MHQNRGNLCFNMIMRNTTHQHNLHNLICFFFIISFTIAPVLTTSINSITPSQFLTKGQTLISRKEEFELGFFTPGTSNNLYIGIWCKNIEFPTFVWVANRDSPLQNSTGYFKINSYDGNLVLIKDSGEILWSTNHSSTGNTVAELLENGNLVLRHETDENPDNYLWQSFDYPTDTLLPGMKLGWDSKTGLNRHITSWKSVNDPATGEYSFKLDTSGDPEVYLWNKRVIDYRSGPWNGISFSGVPETRPGSLFMFDFVRNQDEVSYSYNLTDKTVYSRLVVTNSGSVQRYVWITTSKTWNLFWYAPKDQCDDYRECGVNGICDTNSSPICKCLKGFEPKNLMAWNLRDGSDGCVRRSKLNCDSDGFLRLDHVKLPESGTAFVDAKMDLDDCGKLCRKNCSCRGYSNVDVTGSGAGCVIWTEELFDMREYAAAEGGQSFYLRVAAADLEKAGPLGSVHDSSKNTKKIIKVTVITGGIVAVLLIGLTVFFVRKWRKSRNQRIDFLEHRGKNRREKSQDLLSNATVLSIRDHSSEHGEDEFDLPLFDFSTIVTATDNFSAMNKLGQGGFGCVYKGVLVDGAVIAVKRLSKTSGQGIEEFKNEVKLIARLQHRNLVRLLGCCVETEEKMLIYEYMENKSLDSFLFKKNKIPLLDWQKRFKIICGTARGLLYLHQDSRFRIIHRDLKASNILLDKDMNPKISDFGMARIFGGDQTEGSTKRVVGTYGYMAPEYAMDGLFSVKSDVFSFGVLVMEIVSGMKNRGFYQTNNQLNLLAYAWKLYKEGKALELIDSAAGESYPSNEVMRCIQVGLLCVQENAEDRPNMSNVVTMLSSECTLSMPQPKHPGYCLGRRENDAAPSPDESCTVNQVTVTMIDGR